VDKDNTVTESDETNNEKNITFSATSLSDLVVQDIIWTPTNTSIGETVTFTATIKNQGLGSSSSSRAYFSTTKISFTWNAQAGPHTFKAVVDKDNTVTESDETNNEKTITFSITKSPTEFEITETKFRVGPTVVLRPINDIIDRSQDGLVELYMNNPSLNDVTLNVDARISVPTGIHVYGEGFGSAGAAGVIYGTFSIPPGNSRTILIKSKGDKTGSYTVHFSGLYWPDDNKDGFNPFSLTHPIVVKEPSINPEKLDAIEKSKSLDIPYSYIIIGLIIVIVIVIVIKVIISQRPPKSEIVRDE